MMGKVKQIRPLSAEPAAAHLACSSRGDAKPFELVSNPQLQSGKIWPRRARCITHVSTWSLLAVLVCWAPPTLACDPLRLAEPVTAETLFKRTRDALVEIRPVASVGGAISSGTGFVIDPSGLVVTSLHVVADAFEPAAEQSVEFRMAHGQHGRVEVVSIDLRHDLALLRLDRPLRSAASLELAQAHQTPRLGQRLYAMGNPLDIGMSLTEGNFGGQVRQRFQPLWYYSGALNPGMSGGPVLDACGRVVAVNRASAWLAQSVGFVTPISAVRDMVARTATAPSLADPWAEMTRQAREHQRWLARGLAERGWGSQRLGGLVVPRLHDDIGPCSLDTSTESAARYRTQSLQCRMVGAAELPGSRDVGRLRFHFAVLRGDTSVGPWALALEAQGAAGLYPKWPGLRGEAARCVRSEVAAAREIRLRARLCSVRDPQQPEVQHLRLVFAGRPLHGEVLVGAVDLDTVDWDEGMGILRSLLKSIVPARHDDAPAAD